MTATSFGESSDRRSALLKFADAADAVVARHFVSIGALLVLFVLACGIVRDTREKMWLDEFYTLFMARQAGASEIAHATVEGADGAPPLYSLIVHSILPRFNNDALAVRLPSTLGFAAMTFFLLVFCRRILPPVFALAAVILVCDSCRYFATEGRGYGVLLGATAGALLAWQSAATGRRRTLSLIALAACLALVVCMHYYGLLLLGPLVLVELVRWRESRKPDWAMLAAMYPAILVLLPHRDFIAAAGRFKGHFTAPPMWGHIPYFYGRYAVVYLPLLPVLLLGVALLHPQWRRRIALLPRLELLLMVLLAVMPVIVIVLAMFTTHAYIDRYTLWCVIGTSILPLMLLSAATRQPRAVGTLALLIAGSLFTFHTVRPLRGLRQLRMGQDEFQAIQTLPDTSEPIVVTNTPVFVELAYYLPERYRRRLLHPISRKFELADFGHDTIALMMQAVSHRTQLPIRPYEAVVAQYPRFLLVVSGGDRLPEHFPASGYRLMAVAPHIFEAVRP